MATLEVNNRRINFDSNDYLNLKSLLPKIQKQFPLDTYNVDQFNVNGNSIDINSEDPTLMRPISEADHIEISFSRHGNPLENMVNDLPGATDKIIEKIITCSQHFKEDENDKAIIVLSRVIDAVDTFIQAITYILDNVAQNEELKKTLPIKELQIHLFSVLKAVNTASKKDDTIMLTDLLEYELKDNLTQWKILIIPSIKQNISITH